MAIAPLQLPDAIKPTPIDWSGLDKIGDAVAAGRQQDRIGELLKSSMGPNGTLDAGRAAASLSQAGLLKEALPFLTLQQQKEVLGETRRLHDATIENMAESRRLQEQGLNQTGAMNQAQIENMKEMRRLAQEKETREANAPIAVAPGTELINRGTGQRIYGNNETLLPPETIDQMARQAKAGDNSVFLNLGRGAQSSQNIIAVRKRMAELNAADGETGAEQANRNAEYFGTRAGQRTLGTKQANIEMAATEFNQVLPVVQKASAAVNRTNYPDLNRIMQAWEQKTGDPNIVAFGGGVNTLVNLYSRAISPTGTPTVSDKDHAREILSKAWSQGQFDAAVGMMQQEVQAALNSPAKVREDMRRRFLEGQSPAAAPPPPLGFQRDPSTGLPPPPKGFQVVK